ncbi:MAG: hypothetical protein ACI4AM_02725 [Muribaculaceae bacterium]
MNELFYFVTNSDAWGNDLSGYHDNYFNTEGAFSELFIVALIMGVVVCAVFYFGFCNSVKSDKHATFGNWIICMVVAAIFGFVYSDFITVGSSHNDGTKSGFYQANVDYYNAQAAGCDGQQSASLAKQMNDIETDLNNYDDVRLPLDFTAAFWAVVWYFLASILLKRFTIGGKTIPFTRP